MPNLTYNKVIDDALRELMHSAILEPLTGWLEDDSPESILHALTEMEAEILEDSCKGVVKAFVDGELVGFALVQHSTGALRKSIARVIPNHDLTIGLIFVDPRAQCKGVGKAMVRFVQARETNLIWVCFEDNEPSRKLALSTDFRKYYGSRNPAGTLYEVYQWLK